MAKNTFKKVESKFKLDTEPNDDIVLIEHENETPFTTSLPKDFRQLELFGGSNETATLSVSTPAVNLTAVLEEEFKESQKRAEALADLFKQFTIKHIEEYDGIYEIEIPVEEIINLK